MSAYLRRRFISWSRSAIAFWWSRSDSRYPSSMSSFLTHPRPEHYTQYLSIYQSIYLSIYRSIDLSIYLLYIYNTHLRSEHLVQLSLELLRVPEEALYFMLQRLNLARPMRMLRTQLLDVYAHLCIYMCMYVCMNVCIYVYIYIYIYIRPYMCMLQTCSMYMRTYIYIYSRMWYAAI